MAYDMVLVAPGVAPHASALTATPQLTLRNGQLVMVEQSRTDSATALMQVVAQLVAVPALNVLIVRAGDELYLLPLAGLTIQ